MGLGGKEESGDGEWCCVFGGYEGWDEESQGEYCVVLWMRGGDMGSSGCGGGIEFYDVLRMALNMVTVFTNIQ